MGDKFEKRKNCLYCEKEMDAKYRNKKFCSDKCRVYYGRESAKRYPIITDPIDESLFEGEPIIGKEILLGENVIKVGNPVDKPPEWAEQIDVYYETALTPYEIKKPDIDIDEKAINERIAVLKKELLKPVSSLIPLRVYKKVREDEIKDLESKLKH